MTDSSAVSITAVSKSFGRGSAAVRVLEDVSVEIGQREFFTLLGPSGCGKTTLLRLIAGFETADQGRIAIEGQDVTQAPPFRRPVNTVFQNYALFPHLTVEQNVGFALVEQQMPAAQIRARVGESLEMVRMQSYARRRPAELSGGQQQRVALARALAPRPKVLLLDEPLSALDLKLRKEMQIELKLLQAEAGITFLFVTHDQEEALTLSDRVAVMQGGRILQMGAPREIYETPTHRFVADFIGDINLIEAEALPGNTIRLIGGAQITHPHQAHGRVTLAIRPERARIVALDASHLQARVVHTAYLGTALVHKLALADGSTFLLRQSDLDGAQPSLGSQIGLSLPADSLRVLVQ
ncbi:ABC transporter ATP-binding protein [Defluviimonas sp. WL0002]|uniref:Spermidine/putrescine import ATP-binding protein PotA n=1 Tax=Albidovulum marisflavi TaxID=2984159 RepID=A0ABT2ZA74_9RHOB|nr:ABC transporter ATP-binding protein [Defluviimonas sp. WL0002]MCV2867676.1 ABC transporter ATP-binding protein [Defluviimonas sp. WL0002]